IVLRYPDSRHLTEWQQPQPSGVDRRQIRREPLSARHVMLLSILSSCESTMLPPTYWLKLIETCRLSFRILARPNRPKPPRLFGAVQWLKGFSRMDRNPF